MAHRLETATKDDLTRRIELRNFEGFEVKKTKARPTVRTPQTNEPVPVPSRRKMLFRPGKRIERVLKTPMRGLGYEVPEGSATKEDWAED
jgi:integration host factor subunit beta